MRIFESVARANFGLSSQSAATFTRPGSESKVVCFVGKHDPAIDSMIGWRKGQLADIKGTPISTTVFGALQLKDCTITALAEMRPRSASKSVILASGFEAPKIAITSDSPELTHDQRPVMPALIVRGMRVIGWLANQPTRTHFRPLRQRGGFFCALYASELQNSVVDQAARMFADHLAALRAAVNSTSAAAPACLGRGKDRRQNCMKQFKAAWERFADDGANLTEFLNMKRKRR